MRSLPSSTENIMASTTAAAVRSLPGRVRNQLQSAVTLGVVMTARLWRVRFADRMKPLDQTDARRNVLCAIAASDGVIQTELADQLGVQSSTLVRLLDGLEKQGLVKRSGTPIDRRAKSIRIEPSGREVLGELNSFASKLENEIFANVSDADLTTTARVLGNLTSQLGVPPATS
jgi:MarR family transcriptional regulator, transcriptional regulator for hemolysin